MSCSPAQSLDLDSIAVCLAALTTAEFARAAITCQSWLRSAHRRSAWPAAPSSITALHALADSMVDRAQDSIVPQDVDSSRHRNSRCLTTTSVALADLSNLWIHATEIELLPVHPRHATALQNLARFTQLTALTLHVNLHVECELIAAIPAIRSRLTILHVHVLTGRSFPASLLTQLHLLPYLRVLLMSAPPMCFVPLPVLRAGNSIAPCPSLGSLRLHHFNVDADSFATMRQLLAHAGSIRHLSIVKLFSDFDLHGLLSAPPPAAGTCALESLSLDVALSWDSSPVAFLLPSLRSLRLLRSACSGRLFAEHPSIDCKPLLLLTSIELCMTLSAYQFSVIAARAPNLQSLKCDGVEPDFCSSLRDMPALTRLQTSVDAGDERGRSTIRPLLAALATLPSFSKLVLHLTQNTMDLSALASMQCRSSSWTEIEFSGDESCIPVDSADLIEEDAARFTRLQSIRWLFSNPSGRVQSCRLRSVDSWDMPLAPHTLRWSNDA